MTLNNGKPCDASTSTYYNEFTHNTPRGHVKTVLLPAVMFSGCQVGLSKPMSVVPAKTATTIRFEDEPNVNVVGN